MDNDNGNDKENNGMNNYGGGIGTSDAAILALLADTSRAGRGGGGYGGYGGEGGYGYGGSFGGFSSNAVRTNANRSAIDRNSRDDHFIQLTNQITQFAFAQQSATNAFALANQQQISQLALQLCECCGDNKASLGMIQGKLDCLSKDMGIEINLAVEKQSNQGLLGQIAASQNIANNNAQQGQHAQILAILGQIAGALAGMNNDKGHRR